MVDDRPLGDWVPISRVLLHTNGAITAYADPEVDRLIEAMETALDPDVAPGYQADMIRIHHENFSSISVIAVNVTFATNSRVPTWNVAKRPYDKNYVQIATDSAASRR